MLQGIDLGQVRQYNSTLKTYKDQSASLNAEIEYTNNEIDNLCVQLTQELGIQVTRDNIEQVYNDEVAKINSTLQSGNAVLAKIASEEQNKANSGAVGNVGATAATANIPAPQVASTPVQQNVAPVGNTNASGLADSTLPPFTGAAQPQFSTVNGAVETNDGAVQNMTLPPMFGMGQ
jgi:prefoldin subunit 5